jgi:hypothetical protein
MGRTKKAPEPPVGEWVVDPPFEERPDWRQVADTLRASPMRWLKVYEHGRETWANAIGRGRVNALHPSLGFEFRTTDNVRGTPRTCTLFMRFNPDKVDPLAELLAGRKK